MSEDPTRTSPAPGDPENIRTGRHSKDDMSTSGGPQDPSEVALNSGAYALNALSPEETAEFEAYLAESETTRNEVTELADTAALLSLAVAPVQPSPELKTNLMALIASTPQLGRETPPVRALRAAPPLEEVPQTPSAVEVDDSRQPSVDAPPAPAELGAKSAAKARARWFNRPALALTAVAAAIALVFGGSVVANVVSDANDQRQQADQLAAITGADDVQQAAADISTGGTATLVWSASMGKSVMIVDGLAELPDDKTYELWYIDTAGTPTSAGLFTPDGDSTWRVLDGEMQAGDTVGVTVEPRGGSDQPTTTPIVAITGA